MATKTTTPTSPALVSAALASAAVLPGFWRDKSSKLFRDGVHDGVWQRHVRTRKAVTGLPKLAGSDAPLGWGLASGALSRLSSELLAAATAPGPAAAGRKPKKSARTDRGRGAGPAPLLRRWVDASSSADRTCDVGLGALAAAHLLVEQASELDAETWWAAADALVRLAEETRGWSADGLAPGEAAVAQQLLAGELPLTLSYLLPEMAPLHDLRQEARVKLTEGLLELTNGEGLPHGRHIGWLPLLAACWTRCRLMGGQWKKNAWSSEAETQFRWMVRQLLRWTAGSGEAVLAAAAPTGPVSDEMLACLLRTAGDRSDVAAGRTLRGKHAAPALPGWSAYAPPEPSDHCEWAGLAVLRSDWRPESPVLGVNFHHADVELELHTRGRALLRGAWQCAITVDGSPVAPQGAWEEVCWFSDDDADYLELSQELSNGVVLDRQVLLLRPDEVVWLCDSVRCTTVDPSGPTPHIGYAAGLPLADAIEFSPASETREGLLNFRRQRLGAVLPLALPEWRTDPQGGALQAVDGRLELRQHAAGRALACPLLLDLRPERSLAQLTWRQLTVAQSLEIQPRDVAVGYRAQCGMDQWLFYRSLARRANRTVLGQNTSSEFFAGRFLAPSGEVEQLVEIEG